MSNKKRGEQIKDAARKRADQYDHPSKWSDTYYGFIDGAHWADSHPKIGIDKRLQDFKKEVEALKNIADAEEYAKQLAHLFLGNGLSLKTILLMAIDFGVQHPNWISVEDELPPPHYEGANSTDFVLVYDGFDLEFAYYDFEQKNWHGEDCKEMMFDVTHWMPLPQPPRKEDNNE